jgi:phosphopentomutase
MLERKVFSRAIVIVMDSVGAGALPDAADFGDEGADTLGNIRDHVGLRMPNLGRLGLGRFVPGIDPDGEKTFTGASGRMAERSAGKDTLTGHWEMAGIINRDPFVTFPDGFPPEILEPFTKAVGRGVLANRAASGTEIIKELGEEHMASGDLIVYTSADSVFQIAAHEDVVPIEELYRICEIARGQLRGPFNIARVIARPFIGDNAASFTRTPNRHDYAVNPPAPTLLDMLEESGETVIGVGKIRDIYNGCGVSVSHRTTDNAHGIDVTCELIRGGSSEALLFVNLVDFDMLYGHRRNPVGYRDCLHDFDEALPRILGSMREDDALFITADHGNDPTFKGTDHTREYAPLIVGGDCIGAADLGDTSSYADLGQTVADNFGLTLGVGDSLLEQIRA